MDEFRLHDVVQLRFARPDLSLRQGDQGTIVHCFHVPQIAFEVEFADEFGRTTAMAAFLPLELKLIYSVKT